MTRPALQAEALQRRIEAAGGKALCFATIEILDPPDSRALLAIVDRLAEFDLAIFISANAVNKAINVIHSRLGKIPAGILLACIGRQSAKELKRYGYEQVLVPAGRFDSEGLLAMPELADMQGRRVVIFRGDGGREVLGDGLALRGAEVEYAECYRRARPQTEVSPLLKAWARGEIDVVTLTSADGLRYLYDLLGKLGQSWLIRTPAVALSDRIAAVARELGFKAEIRVAPEASDEALVATLEAWHEIQKPL